MDLYLFLTIVCVAGIIGTSVNHWTTTKLKIAKLAAEAGQPSETSDGGSPATSR